MQQSLNRKLDRLESLNPYFIGLPILIPLETKLKKEIKKGLNPYFIGLPILIIPTTGPKIGPKRTVSILILLDYLFLYFRR